MQQEILNGQKIPLEVLEVIAKIKSESKQIEAFERYFKKEIDSKDIKAEYLSNKIKPKNIPISFNKKKGIVSINLSQYTSKDEAIKAFTTFLKQM